MDQGDQGDLVDEVDQSGQGGKDYQGVFFLSYIFSQSCQADDQKFLAFVHQLGLQQEMTGNRKNSRKD